MKKITDGNIAPEDFLKFHVAGTHIVMTEMPGWCVECPALLKDEPLNYISNGWCRLREIYKRRSDRVPQICKRWTVEAALIGCEVALVEREEAAR